MTGAVACLADEHNALWREAMAVDGLRTMNAMRLHLWVCVLLGLLGDPDLPSRTRHHLNALLACAQGELAGR